MQDLVDQAHGVDLSSLDSLFGKCDQVELLIHALGKDPRGVKVGKEYIAAEGEHSLFKLVVVPRLT